jgi:hypothetical protein
MKRASAILLLLLVLAGFAFAAETAKNPTIVGKDPYDLQVKKLYSAPAEESNLIYNIPIEVKLLDVSADANWYKVKISFSLGPLGYTFVGWTKIPVGEILASRAEKVAKTPEPARAEE